MDSNNDKRKYVPGILIMTLIFLCLSIFSVNNFMKKSDDKKVAAKGSYQSLLEERLGTKLEGEDEFAIFELVGYDLVVIPDKYNDYFKPCFDFVIARDGVIIKNHTAKEFFNYPLTIGSKIVKIGDKELNGLGYFEIVDLIYSNELNVSKMFTLESGETFEYRYEKYSNKEEISVLETETIIKFYSLDNISRKGIYEKASSANNITFDLSNATVSDPNDMKTFMSYFTKGNQELFASPVGMRSLESYKLNGVTINLGENIDEGVIFMASALKSLDANVTIVGLNTAVEEYKTYSLLQNADYTIYLYDYVLKTKSSSSNNGGVII